MNLLKKIVTNIALVIAGICFTILLAEIVVRIFYPESRDHVLPAGLYENDSYLGWKLSKEKSVTHHSSLFNISYSTNSFGFRDKERNNKKDDKFRILLCGDSQIFGWGNPVEKRFSNLLEKSLPGIEMWNLGVPAYGLDQELLLYKKEVFETDVVIFFVSDYTLSRINYDYLYQKSKPKFLITKLNGLNVIPPKEPGVFKSFVYNSIRWMYLPFFLEEKISALSGKPLAKENNITSDSKSNGNILNELEQRLLLFGKDLTESRNNLMIILYNNTSGKGNAVKDFCVRNGIICYDINLKENEGDLILGSTDGHWNAKANEIIFNNILPDVRQLVKVKSELNHLSN